MEIFESKLQDSSDQEFGVVSLLVPQAISCFITTRMCKLEQSGLHTKSDIDSSFVH